MSIGARLAEPERHRPLARFIVPPSSSEPMARVLAMALARELSSDWRVEFAGPDPVSGAANCLVIFGGGCDGVAEVGAGAPVVLAPLLREIGPGPQLDGLRGLLTVSEAERRAMDPSGELPNASIGLGSDARVVDVARAGSLRLQIEVTGPLLAYIGDLTLEAYCDLLLGYWCALRDRPQAQDKTLLLVGDGDLRVPPRPDLRVLARANPEGAALIVAQTDVVVLPGGGDLLCSALIMAWQAGVPVLADARHHVAVDLIRRSGGGLTYANAEEFIRGQNALLRDPASFGSRGRAWLREERTWSRIAADVSSVMRAASEA